MKPLLRWILTLFMVVAGLNHFRHAAVYVGMMPSVLPAPLFLVYLSGVAEVAVGVGLIPARTRVRAAWGLIALLVAVFPANINMAVNHLPLGDTPVATWVLWGRLPLQAVLIAWARWYTRPDIVMASGPARTPTP